MTTDLRQLNEEITQAENNPDARFFRALLSEKLLFRRANGNVVGKEKFLHDLQAPDRPAVRRILEDMQVMQIPEVETQALVAAIICVEDGNTPPKRYQNIRFFTHTETGWRLDAWYNYEITAP